MTVAYDGRRFHGFAPNTGVLTVGGALSEVIGRILRHPVELVCAGRTDAGVHARGQVVSFDASAEDLDLARLAKSVNKLLGPGIAVRDVRTVDDGFDARHSALARVYRYTVLNTPWPDPFWAGRAWHVDAALDRDLLRLGADPLIGEHDFSSFCRRPEADAPLVRRVRDARWEDAGDGILHFWIEASSFCHQMVRSIVGLLVDMGSGRRRPGEMVGILRARDRQVVGNVAPPDGLSLWEVRY
jgi:tRNA pseudouridine38-40 synthase